MSEQAAIARAHMVDSQVRPNQVNDRRVIAAMRELPREAFAPASAIAYSDADIDLGNGRFMPAPLLIGRLVQLVMASDPAHVLVIGAGSGYGAALLAHCGAQVVALEDTAPPAGWDALARWAPGVTAVRGPLTAGWPAGGPYDAILIEGAVCKIPENLAVQLTPSGRVVAVVVDGPPRLGLNGGIGRAVVAQPAASGFACARMFDCTARLLPAFAPAPAFHF